MMIQKEQTSETNELRRENPSDMLRVHPRKVLVSDVVYLI
jgi:hypothetical protein